MTVLDYMHIILRDWCLVMLCNYAISLVFLSANVWLCCGTLTTINGICVHRFSVLTTM